MQGFKKIFAFGRSNPSDHATAETLLKLNEVVSQLGATLHCDEDTAQVLKLENKIATHHKALQDNEYDLVIVVGGDGSFLQAARQVVFNQIPILGVNRGRLGFLTDISPFRLEQQITQVMQGQYTVEERFLLKAKVLRDDMIVAEQLALNDCVLLPGFEARLIDFDLSINQQLVCQERADGLIIATPTGSTAYALSGGGPILHPDLNAVTLVPMFPHTLSSRPIVVNGDSQIQLQLNSFNTAKPKLSCDGQESIPLFAGDIIQVSKLKPTLKLIHPIHYNYYATLQSKLGWLHHHSNPE